MSNSNPLEIVDISEVNEDAAAKIVHAASTQGFLMLEGHGFSQDEVDRVYELSHEFFSLPVDEKSKYPIDASNAGYAAMYQENLEENEPDKPVGDPKEGFNFSGLDLKTGIPDQKLPELFLEKDNMATVSATVLKLRQALKRTLQLLALGLNIDDKDGGKDWFADRHGDELPSGSAFRFLHYPSPVKPGASEEEKSKHREINIAGAHTDYGTITMLFQKKDEDGLEILSPITKKWESVPYVPASAEYSAKGEAPPLVVNIADMLSYWTNGYLKSTIHRVRFPNKLLDEGKDRYSIVFFVQPGDDTLLEPVPSKATHAIQGRGAAEYLERTGKSQSAGEHLAKRLASSYGWGKY